MITNKDVKEFFKDLRDANCQITNELINGGYKQEKYGYIDIAKVANLDNPSQWWHLMNYLLLKEELHQENEEFSNLIVCGELIFYMAEVSNALSKEELIALKDKILKSNDLKNRRKWNNEIKLLCWEKIILKLKTKEMG